ncbi:MAG: PSD1 and planctomycete cytochrome C domain-containing protein [Planctomycetota bacterium]|nr:PSD1 and planctomycete cytochrome C domain-containing protein [Planctomycetota bacterium]
MQRFLRLLLVGVLCLTASERTHADESRSLRFESDVRPILKTHCWQCHGEEEDVKGGFDARLARLLLKGGESGPAIVPGKHGESLLYRRVVSGEMPPGKKRISAREISLLARWIDSGAATARPEPETLLARDAFTEEERQHWSFQPIRRPALPNVKQPDRLRAPVDAFLLSRLESQGSSFGPEADKRKLIRRLFFNLIGLPPAPDVVETFVAAELPDAHERMVDELLASPRYGERWGRHWLDVTGYADSDGYTGADVVRKWAYKYRDYVIRSFNSDKPWTEFLVEQLAGDELLTPPYQDLTPEEADRLIATGFLRMGPDGTGGSNGDQSVARNQVIAETIKIVSTSLLGLSVGCAQCHPHRYDPITHADYHRIRALLEPAYDWKKWRAPNARLVSQWPQEVRRRAAAVDKELQDISQQRNGELDALVRETLVQELAKLPVEIQSRAKAARETPAEKRSGEQQTLFKEYPFLKISRDTIQQFVPDQVSMITKKWDERTATAKKKRPVDDDVMCLSEVPGTVPPTLLFARGDFNQPRQEIVPGELSVLNPTGFAILPNDPQLPTTGRRLAYARHLTSGRHPLVTRVLVNRFWMHHFGHGLVATPTDFGMRSEGPSHPELLDWIAADFMRGDWELKRLHRMIVTAAVYRQVSTRREELEAIDPENRLLGRMHVRRLEAETLRDSLIALGGQLSSKMYGDPVPVSPDVSGQGIILSVNRFNSAGQVVRGPTDLGEEVFRRTVYIQVRRSMPLGMLELFDLPAMTPNCERRASSTVAPQALLMMNNPLVVREALAFAARVQREAGTGLAAQFQLAWRLAFGRPASDREVRAGVKFLNEQANAVRAAPGKPKTETPDPATASLAHLCQALLSSNAFLYVD